jgi:hypothetical protein
VFITNSIPKRFFVLFTTMYIFNRFLPFLQCRNGRPDRYNLHNCILFFTLTVGSCRSSLTLYLQEIIDVALHLGSKIPNRVLNPTFRPGRAWSLFSIFRMFSPSCQTSSVKANDTLERSINDSYGLQVASKHTPRTTLMLFYSIRWLINIQSELTMMTSP